MTTPAPAPTQTAPAAPSIPDQIHAIRDVQKEQALKIGAACVAHTGPAKTPFNVAELAAEVEILAGLDLAATILQAQV